MQSLVGVLFRHRRRRLSLSSSSSDPFSLSFFSSSSSAPSSPFKTHFSTSTTTSSSSTLLQLLENYLTDTFSFPKQTSLKLSNSLIHYNRLKSLEKPISVVQFLRRFGFSDPQIKSTILGQPNTLVADVYKVLEPKLDFFRTQLGLASTDLANIVSKNPRLLLSSLDNKLIPIVSLFKKLLINDSNNRDLVKVLYRSYRFIGGDTYSRLLSNVAFLEKCKIVRIDVLLVRNPYVFALPESVLRERVSHLMEMGFRVDSGMFVVGLCALTTNTFDKKLQLYKSLGFSENECIEMFKKAPCVFGISEEKMKFGVNFFLSQTDMFARSLLVRRPIILKYNMKDRVIPRCRVLRVIKNKRLLKKDPSFCAMFDLSEDAFVKRYISRFGDSDAKELLIAYKGNDSSNN